MGDENPIHALGDYSKPSHEGYRNTIELPVGNNVVPLRSDTIRLVQNECSFHGLRSEDPNQHLKDFLKLVDSLDLDGSITTWEDLTTRFLAQFFPPGRTEKLRNDILMFQQYHGESLSEAWTHFWDLLQKCEIDHAARGKLRDKNVDESWEIIDNLALYDHEGWNDIKEFVKPVKAQVRDYMVAPTKRMERFENAIFKQREEINDRMAEMKEEERNEKEDIATDGGINKKNTEIPVKEAKKESKADDGTKNEPTRKTENEEAAEVPSSQPVGYYLKHRINKKLIEGFVDNHRFNNSLSEVRVGKIKGKTYNVSPRGPMYEAILKKKITRKEDIGGNFEIPIAEDVLVEVAEYVYSVDFVILDIKEDEKRPFIIGTPFLTTAKAVIKLDKGTITLRSGKTPTMTVNRLFLEWEEKIKLHLEREMKFNQWRSKKFKSKHPALGKVKSGMNDEGEVT
ncbi:MAK10-like protein [Tanacetum coccineum]